MSRDRQPVELKELFGLYERIYREIMQHAAIAKKEQKKLLLLVGEEHKGYGCFLLKTLIIDIATKYLNINTALYEHTLVKKRDLKAEEDGHYYLDCDYLHSLGVTNQVMIDTFNTDDNRKKYPYLTFFHLRNQSMQGNINNCRTNAIVFIGAAHIHGLLEEYPINKEFHVCILNTNTRLPTNAEERFNSTKETSHRHIGGTSLDAAKKWVLETAIEIEDRDDVSDLNKYNQIFGSKNFLAVLNNTDQLNQIAKIHYEKEKGELDFYSYQKICRSYTDEHDTLNLPFPSRQLLSLVTSDNQYQLASIVSAQFSEKKQDERLKNIARFFAAKDLQALNCVSRKSHQFATPLLKALKQG